MTTLYGMAIFALADVPLYYAGEMLVSGLLRLARFYRIKEFIAAFFVMAFAGVPSSTSTRATLTLTDIHAEATLAVDYSGDGDVELSYDRAGTVSNAEPVSDEDDEEVAQAVVEPVTSADGLVRSSGSLLGHVAVPAGLVAGITSLDDETDKQVYYQELHKLLQELEVLLNLLAERYII